MARGKTECTVNNRSVNIFLASALGGAVGTLVALELNAVLWWLGMLAGGVVGYFSYEWKRVLAAVPAAYRAASGWQRQPSYGKAVLVYFRGTVVIWSWLVCGGVAFDLLSMSLKVDKPVSGLLLGIGVTTLISLFLFLITCLMLCSSSERMLAQVVLSESQGFPEQWRYLAPYVLVWTLPRFLIVSTFRLIVWIPRAIRTGFAVAFRFGWQLFLRIHSEERLICGVDAALGAAAGYFAGSALIGAVAGGLIGLLNYRLVTLRWLVPAGYITLRHD